MNTSTKGIKLIKQFEGCLLTASNALDGVWTIGYGHTGKVDGQAISQGMTITAAKAEALLKSDLTAFETAVSKAVKVTMTSNMFDALVSFTYNLGAGALQRSDLLGYLNNKQYTKAAAEFARWVNCNGKALPGLVKRRAAEKALFLTDCPKDGEAVGGTTTSPSSAKTTAAAASTATVSAGKAVALTKEPLYASATASKQSTTVSGQYWLWDSAVVSGRVRITSRAAYVGKTGQVTGWIREKAVK